MNKFKYNTDKYIKRIKDGDVSAFDDLYDLCFAPLYRVAYSLLLSNAEAEDVTQDTFISILNHLNNIDTRGNTWSYMITALKNKAFNVINKRKRMTSLDKSIENGYQPEYHEEYDTPTLDIAKRILAPDDLSLVVMCSIEGYTLKEVSQILNIPLSTVHYKYKKALQTIENELNKEVEHEKN